MYGFIYITTNIVNGKRYLGQCNYQKRNHKKYLGSGKYLREAVKKYGSKNFSRTVVAEAKTKEELNVLETNLIEKFNCTTDPMWYNIAPGGYTTRGFANKKHSDATKELMRKNHKRILTEEGRMNISNSSRIRGKESGQFPKTPVTIHGIKYSSMKEANEETGLSLHQIRRIVGLVTLESAEMKSQRISKICAQITCPICGKSGSRLPMLRFHFSRCKSTPTN